MYCACRAFDQCVAPAASALLCDSMDQECICSGYRINRGSVLTFSPLSLFIPFLEIPPTLNQIHPLLKQSTQNLDATPSTAPPRHGNSKTEVPSADLYPLSWHNFSPPALLRIQPPSSRVMAANQPQHQQEQALQL